MATHSNPSRVNKIDTDFDLVKRTQRGDRHTFDMLVVRHQRKIAHVISRYIKSSQDVEDVAQETFIKAYRGIASFRGESQFSTWLHRIAVNTAMHFLSARRSRIPNYEPMFTEDAEEMTIPETVDDEDPERILANQQIAESIAETLKKLPEELRTAITLREVEGLSYEEIAQVMNCPIGTVRSRIFRAREQAAGLLRKLLDPVRDNRW
ncbi:MAG: RNA polymerase sigma factor RpoE [Nitrosospira sp.]|nr:RNA polymerase sigma factor RpoE [Nitrosospira sp.]